MPRLLTARTIETIAPGPSRQEIPDRYLPNFYLIVQPSGHRSWAVRYRVQGRARKHTLGSYPALDLKSARELATRAFRAVAEGRDPSREKAQARAAPIDTVESVAEQFFQLHCKRVNRPRTIAGNRALLDNHVLPRWRRRLIKDITRRDVIDLLDSVVQSGSAIAANRVLTIVRKMFAWALARDILASSPAYGVEAPTPEQSRDRVLTDVELGNVWRAADRMGGPYGVLVKLLALTGQRRDEVARMTWRELDLDANLWRLPKARTRNGKPHHIPLSGLVCGILQTLPRVGDYVLTTAGAVPAGNFTLHKRTLDALLPPDMPPWRLHDLRRTCASGLARLGVSLPVIEKCLNHTSGSFAGIVGVYQHHDFAVEKREALERWAQHVLALAAP